MSQSNSKTTDSFYAYFENLKNKIYREVSGARQGGLFWPSWIYSWNYSKEKVHYNNLKNRQNLGPNIDQKSVEEYNKIRANILPHSRYYIKTKSIKTPEGERFDNVVLRRRNYPLYAGLCILTGIVATDGLHLTRWWIYISFTPLLALYYYDSKNYPEEEIGNFLNYAIAKRNTTEINMNSKKEIDALIKNDSKAQEVAKSIKEKNLTLDAVMSSLYNQYLNEAKKEL